MFLVSQGVNTAYSLSRTYWKFFAHMIDIHNSISGIALWSQLIHNKNTRNIFMTWKACPCHDIIMQRCYGPQTTLPHGFTIVKPDNDC